MEWVSRHGGEGLRLGNSKQELGSAAIDGLRLGAAGGCRGGDVDVCCSLVHVRSAAATRDFRHL